MQNQQNYAEDLTEIRQIMERSSRFMSLSGLSGVLAGIYALIGAYLAYQMFNFSDEIIYHALSKSVLSANVTKLILLAVVVLILAIATAVAMSYRKAAKSGEKVWNTITKRLLTNLMIPLVTGGIFVLILFSKGAIGLIAPTTLLFYGLALINASKYTLTDIRYLGLCEIALGLMSAFWIGYGLLFWALGFGVLHIIYGVVMYIKYER